MKKWRNNQITLTKCPLWQHLWKNLLYLGIRRWKKEAKIVPGMSAYESLRHTPSPHGWIKAHRSANETAVSRTSIRTRTKNNEFRLTQHNTPFQLSGLVFRFFKISLVRVIWNFWPKIHVQHPHFSRTANFHDLSVSDFNFMRITNLKIYKGFNRE